MVTLLSPLTFSDQSDHNHSSSVCAVYVCACDYARPHAYGHRYVGIYAHVCACM